MSAGDMVALLEGGGGALGILVVFCAMFISGLIVPKSVVEERDGRIEHLERLLELERQRSDVIVQTGHVVREVMQSLPRRPEQ